MRRKPVHCDRLRRRARQRQTFFARCLRGLITLALGLCSVTAVAQLSTEDHVAEPGFWPTKSQPSLADFAGKESCARCHAGIARSQQASAMGRTAMHAGSADVLRDHPHLQFQYADDTFRIETKTGPGGVTSTYSAEDKTRTFSDPLLWIFGTGRVGQSYLFKKEDDHFYEARVTFFRSLNNIGFTPARSLEHPTDIETAMGRRVETAELIRCFSCHATAVNIADDFNEKGLTPGVTCEACHGPGAAHVQLMQPDGKTTPAHKEDAVFDPSHLSPTESVEFCGACHGSWWDVKLAHVTGPSTVRSAPYRLVTSKCWGKEGDERLKCTACHDPHKDLATDIASYDGACLRCHANGPGAAVHAANVATSTTPRAPACPVATSKCASCHMPQVYVPEMQNTFTDHRIRVVHQGEAFKD